MKKLTKRQAKILRIAARAYGRGYNDGYDAALGDVREGMGEATDRGRTQAAKRAHPT